MSAALATGVLAAAGAYLVLQRGLVRIVVGILILQHAVNLLLVTARGPARTDAPILPAAAPGDPLGQAFVLTAIIVGFGVVILLLAVALGTVRRGGDHEPGEATGHGREEADDPDGLDEDEPEGGRRPVADRGEHVTGDADGRPPDDRRDTDP